jgi:hypothetical protein
VACFSMPLFLFFALKEYLKDSSKED